VRPYPEHPDRVGGVEDEFRALLAQRPPALGERDVPADLQADAPHVEVEDREPAARRHAALQCAVRPGDRERLVVDAEDLARAVEHDEAVEDPPVAAQVDGAGDVGRMLAGLGRHGGDQRAVHVFGDFRDVLGYAGDVVLRQDGDVERPALGRGLLGHLVDHGQVRGEQGLDAFRQGHVAAGQRMRAEADDRRPGSVSVHGSRPLRVSSQY
jgi:hypothetical protein